jgi:hypothetical protein
METRYDKLNKKIMTVSNLSKNSASQIFKKKKQQRRPQFYPRVQNLTEIKFTKEELKVLYLGFHCSIEKPLTTYFASPVIEVENVVKLLDA